MTLRPSGVKVHLALGFIDMRKGIDGLAMLVQGVLRQDPFSGHLFVSRGRSHPAKFRGRSASRRLSRLRAAWQRHQPRRLLGTWSTQILQRASSHQLADRRRNFTLRYGALCDRSLHPQADSDQTTRRAQTTVIAARYNAEGVMPLHASCPASKSSSKRKCFTLRPRRRTSFRASTPILICLSTKFAVTI